MPKLISTRAKHYKEYFFVAAQKMVEDVGNRLAIIDKHLKKLSIYLSEKQPSMKGMWMHSWAWDRSRTVFELTDAAVAQRNAAWGAKSS